MNLFERVKGAITVPMAAECYGPHTGRKRMICCPFHPDQHPSMRLNEDYFYCFGCHAHGDVIDLVARLYGLGNYDAAKKLAADFALSPHIQPPTVSNKVVNQSREAHKQEIYCADVLCKYLHWLEDRQRLFAPENPEEKLDARYVVACRELDVVNELLDILCYEIPDVKAATVKEILADGTISRMEQELKREEGDTTDAEERQ